MKIQGLWASAAWLLLAAPALAGEPASALAEREQIRMQRSEVEAGFKKGEKACRERFVVSSCIEDLQVQRREALALLRDREIALDEAKRQAQAEDNARRLEAKRAAALRKPVPAPAPRASAPPAANASAPVPSERARRRSKTADDAGEAAARAVAQQRRIAEGEARRQQVEQRNAERAASGKKSSPLPIPAPLPPASAASR